MVVTILSCLLCVFQLIHKKYIAGHKYHSGPLEKAQAALKKHRKKSKAAKYGFDQKEFQVCTLTPKSAFIYVYHSAED